MGAIINVFSITSPREEKRSKVEGVRRYMTKVINQISFLSPFLSCSLDLGSTNCAILTSQMAEKGVNLENLGKMKNILLMIQNTLYVTQNSLFVNHMTQNTLLNSIYGDG